MFNKPFIALLCLSLNLSMLSLSAWAQTGLELMQQYQRLHEVDSQYTRSSMTLVNKKGRERVRTMQTYEKKSANGENRSLLKFLSPKNPRVPSRATLLA